MPYADPTSEEAVASRRRASRKYYSQNRDREIARCAAYSKANKEKVAANAVARRSQKMLPEKVLWWNARNRSKRAGIEFSICVDDIVVPDRCPIPGIPLVVATGHAKDGSPSIDRIDPAKGYVPGNVAIISHKANTIKSNASLADLQAVVDWLKTVLEKPNV